MKGYGKRSGSYGGRKYYYRDRRSSNYKKNSRNYNHKTTTRSEANPVLNTFRQIFETRAMLNTDRHHLQPRRGPLKIAQEEEVEIHWLVSTTVAKRFSFIPSLNV
jgi:hypothetical protein